MENLGKLLSLLGWQVRLKLFLLRLFLSLRVSFVAVEKLEQLHALLGRQLRGEFFVTCGSIPQLVKQLHQVLSIGLEQITLRKELDQARQLLGLLLRNEVCKLSCLGGLLSHWVCLVIADQL